MGSKAGYGVSDGCGCSVSGGSVGGSSVSVGIQGGAGVSDGGGSVAAGSVGGCSVSVGGWGWRGSLVGVGDGDGPKVMAWVGVGLMVTVLVGGLVAVLVGVGEETSATDGSEVDVSQDPCGELCTRTDNAPGSSGPRF